MRRTADFFLRSFSDRLTNQKVRGECAGCERGTAAAHGIFRIRPDGSSLQGWEGLRRGPHSAHSPASQLHRLLLASQEPQRRTKEEKRMKRKEILSSIGG